MLKTVNLNLPRNCRHTNTASAPVREIVTLQRSIQPELATPLCGLLA